MSSGQTPNDAKFHRARPNDRREKLTKIFTHSVFSFGAPGGPQGQNAPIFALTYSKTPSIKIPFLNLPNLVDFVAGMTDKNISFHQIPGISVDWPDP